jgi:hypothetical protein
MQQFRDTWYDSIISLLGLSPNRIIHISDLHRKPYEKYLFMKRETSWGILARHTKYGSKYTVPTAGIW